MADGVEPALRQPAVTVRTVAGNVIGGSLSDRWGREWVFALGSGFGMRISLLAAIPTDLFTGRHRGVILGAAQGGGGLGGFIGPLLGGWRFDVTGSYQIAFAVAALAIAASAEAAWVAAPRRIQAARHAARRATRRIGL